MGGYCLRGWLGWWDQYAAGGNLLGANESLLSNQDSGHEDGDLRAAQATVYQNPQGIYVYSAK